MAKSKARAERRNDDDDDRRKKRRPSDDDDEDQPKKKRGRAIEEDDEEEEDEEEDFGDEGPRRKKKTSQKTVRTIMISVASVLGGIGIIILLYWIYSPLGFDSQLLCYVPPDAVEIKGVDLGDIQKITEMDEVAKQMPMNWKAGGGGGLDSQNINIQRNNAWKEEQIEKWLYARAPKDRDLIRQYPNDEQQHRGFIEVVRFKDVFDENAIMKGFEQAGYQIEDVTANGKSYKQLFYYEEIPKRKLKYSRCIWFPNKRTVVLASTRAECEKTMERIPGRIAIDGHLRKMVDRIDGQYFEVVDLEREWDDNDFNWDRGIRYGDTEKTFSVNRLPPVFQFGFLHTTENDALKIKEEMQKLPYGRAFWWASNGNEFMAADALEYKSVDISKPIYDYIDEKASEQRKKIYGSDSGKSSEVTNPFAPPKQKNNPMGGSSGGSEADKDAQEAAEAMNEYVKRLRVYRRGEMIVTEGRMSQENFGKLWKYNEFSKRYKVQQMGFGGYGGPGGGPPGMPPGMPPGGPPGGPPR